MPEPEAIELYQTMLRIRLFEERVFELASAKRIYGPVHLYIGQEAVAAGVCSHLRGDDYVASTHRGHGHLIAKGGRYDRMMAELFAKQTGYCKGKGGSMHIADMSLGIVGANGIVGAGMPLAAGSAFASTCLGNDRVSVAFFGDGAANQGTFLEAINIAALHKLPALFVCEHNGYSVGTKWSEVSGHADVADRAQGLGLPGVKVDAPSCVADVAGLMRASIRDDNPVVFCYQRSLAGQTGSMPPPDHVVPIGKADVKRTGSDATIVAYGAMVPKALAAATELATLGIEAEVVDLRTLLPLDEETVLRSVAKTGRLIVAAETYAACSVASEVAALMMEKGFHLLRAPLGRVHFRFAPIPFSAELFKGVVPQADAIVQSVAQIVRSPLEE